MTIHLLNARNESVLSARTNHARGNACSHLPVVFEGDTSLLIAPPPATANVGILEALMLHSSYAHPGLRVDGDHGKYSIRDNLVP